MSALDETDQDRRARGPRVSARWSLTASVLLLASAALQLAASLERWVVLRDAWPRTDISIEDHRFDYSIPSDPWEPLGTTAQVFGLSSILLAGGILAMARSVESRQQTVASLGAIAAAASFGVNGAHAVISGLIGVPSPVQFGPVQWVLTVAGLVGLGYAGARWLSSSWAAAVACLFLLGSTLPGLLIAAFVIAPSIAGYQSHDTTPWTETVLAASPALAGIAMLASAIGAAVSHRRRDA